MRCAVILALAAWLFTALAAQAGNMHPAVEEKLYQVAPDEPISVIVHMVDQAPIAQLSADLSQNRATRGQRHREIVTALKDATRSQESLLAELNQRQRYGGITGYTSYWIANLLVIKAVRWEIEQIAARSDVDFVELNFVPELIAPINGDGRAETETGSRGIGVTPGLRAINAPRVWYELGYTGAGRLVGSLDTGVDGAHPALASRWRGTRHPPQECWLDVLGTGTTFPADFNDHGTHTTGTMTGLAPDDTVGVAWEAEWIACNAIDQGVSTDFDNDIITAFQWFADPDGNPESVDDVPDVVQNSWGVNESFPGGYTDCDSRWWAVIDNCEAAGVVTCWSAGNEGSSPGTLRSPSDRATTLTNCFSVGAVNATDYDFPYPIAGFSSRGPSGCDVPPENEIKPEVVAPGVTVYSTVPGGGFEQLFWDGTSMSGPHVAGIVALMREANPDLEVEAIKLILMQTARDLGTLGEDNTFGWGIVDAYAAVQAAVTGFGRLEGIVRNASYNDVAIDGAVIELVDRDYRFTTDEEGQYSGLAAADVYTARASSPGFDTEEFSVEIISDAITVQDFSLTDIAGPVITHVTQLLAVSDAVGPYTIAADVFDHSSVSLVKLFYRFNSSTWQEQLMTSTGNIYEGVIPGQPPNTQVDYYVWAEDGVGLSSTAPASAPAEIYTFIITQEFYTYQGEDPGDPDWELGVASDAASTGMWIRGDPVGTDYFGLNVQPEDDHTPSFGVACFVTGNANPGDTAGTNDVDDGCTTLISPTFDLSTATQAFVKYWRWYGEGGNSIDDEFVVDVSEDGGTTWLPLERVVTNQNSWRPVVVDLSSVIDLTAQVVFRYVACDLNTGGLVEAAIDDFSIEVSTVDITSIPGDDGPNRPLFTLAQNRPNPFNPKTTISFTLPSTQPVTLSVYAVNGRRVATLINDEMPAGPHHIDWDGRDLRGHQMASGTYFYQLKGDQFSQTRRMVLIK